MAWMDTLQNASFKGIQFDVESVSDAFARSVASNEYPYTDGADHEDMGMQARRMRFVAFLWGSDYERRLQVLLAALKTAGAGELVHPVFGVIKRAMCVLWNVEHHVDQRDSCRVELSFLESGAAVRVFVTPSPVLAAERIGALSLEARRAADAPLVDRVDAVATGPVAKAMTLRIAMQGALLKLRALADTTSLKALVSDLDPVLFPRAYVNDAQAILDIALQGLPFGGRNLLFEGTAIKGSGRGDFDRAAVALGPEALTVPAADENGALVQAHARVHGACSLAEAASIVLVGEMETALMERAELERLAATTRAAIQAALEGMRATAPGAETGAPLRALAYQVQAATQAVIEQRPPVVRKPAPITGPLRLVAHALYGDHTRAAELVRLNRFGRTLGVAAGQELSQYAR